MNYNKELFDTALKISKTIWKEEGDPSAYALGVFCKISEEVDLKDVSNLQKKSKVKFIRLCEMFIKEYHDLINDDNNDDEIIKINLEDLFK